METPAAQYLRMSTEHQRYSLMNQAAVIAEYAQTHAFAIVRTYSDAAKSGLNLKHRYGLQQLLQDVVRGDSGFRAVLVYDVSRWGRFQDTDEAAHYEFLCKQAGIPVHYCAEAFANDSTMSSLIIKTLKRTMAAEYSRELSVKVLAGQKRLASLGFWQGAVPGYGFRRMLVSADRSPKHFLRDGERKSIATDRVVLVPGSPEEVAMVRRIYQMLIDEGRTVNWIARELNRNGIPFVRGSEWDYTAVHRVLTHPKYAGCHVYGRTSQKLCTRAVRTKGSEWTITPGAFEPIIDRTTFDAAQRILQGRHVNRSNEDLLADLRAVLAAEGKLSMSVLRSSRSIPCASTYRRHFGAVRHAYELIGYKSNYMASIISRRKMEALRDGLIAQVQAMFPGDVTAVRRGRRRPRLLVHAVCEVTVAVSRRIWPWKDTIRWQVDPIPDERSTVTLLARLNLDNTAFQDFHVLPSVDRPKRFTIKLTDDWLKRGTPLTELSDFCSVVTRVWTDKIDSERVSQI